MFSLFNKNNQLLIIFNLPICTPRITIMIILFYIWKHIFSLISLSLFVIFTIETLFLLLLPLSSIIDDLSSKKIYFYALLYVRLTYLRSLFSLHYVHHNSSMTSLNNTCHTTPFIPSSPLSPVNLHSFTKHLSFFFNKKHIYVV